MTGLPTGNPVINRNWSINQLIIIILKMDKTNLKSLICYVTCTLLHFTFDEMSKTRSKNFKLDSKSLSLY